MSDIDWVRIWIFSAAIGLTLNVLFWAWSAYRLYQLRQAGERDSIITLAFNHVVRDVIRSVIQGIGLAVGLFAYYRWNTDWIVPGLVSLQCITVVLAIVDYLGNRRARKQEDAWWNETVARLAAKEEVVE